MKAAVYLLVTLSALALQTSSLCAQTQGQVPGVTSRVGQKGAPTITVTDLGTLSDAKTIWPTDISERGEIIGLARWSYPEDDWEPSRGPASFYWSARTGFVEVALPGRHVFVSDINDRGLVVGSSFENFDGPPQGFIWDSRTGLFQDVETSFIPVKINNRGVMFGYRLGLPHPYLYAKGRLYQMPHSDVLGSWWAVNWPAINDKGVVFGGLQSAETDFRSRAFTWSLRDGLELLEMPSGMFDSFVTSVSNDGRIAGTVHDASGEGFAASWGRDGQIEWVSPISQGWVTGMNQSNWTIRDETQLWIGEQGPFIFPSPSPGNPQVVARVMNNRGQIAGWASTWPSWHLVLWTVHP